MKLDIGDLVFCHTIGNKMGWRLNQIGVDIENGNVELIAKANGEKVKLNKDLEVIPNYMKKIQDAAENIDEELVERAFNQRALINNKLNKLTKNRKRRLKFPGH